MRRVLIFLSLMGWAVSARAQIDNTALECGSGATFFPRGDHWPMQPGYAVNYRIQEDGDAGISGGQDLQAIRNAFAEWMGTSCSGGSPNIRVQEGSLYDSRDRGDTYDAQGNLTVVNNVAYFVTSNWDAIADSQTVALSTNLFVPDTGYIVTSDIEFNSQYFDWRASGYGCAAGTTNCYDVESVALHEIGHFLGFNHVMCTDAAMFPEGSGTSERHELPTHEQEGLCTIYAPRNAVADRDVGEQCSSTTQCPPLHTCIKPYGHDASSPWGWCAKTCSSTSNCDRGFMCVPADNGTNFCKPGPNDTGGAATGGTGTGMVDPETGESLDLCAPCNDGAQCASGVCVSAAGTTGMCTQVCLDGSLPGDYGTGTGCPDGMDCVQTDQGWNVCWGTGCGSVDYRGGLNDLCYQQLDPYSDLDDWYQSCGPDLVCFAFAPRCAGQEGRCVTYCNAVDTPCPDRNQQCCFGVDEFGNCIAYQAGGPEHGGCFDLRSVGETCIKGEQSICESAAGCFHFEGEAAVSRCYRRCAGPEGCSPSDVCVGFPDTCGSSVFGLCCAADQWSDATGCCCVPSDDVDVYDVGVACRDNDDCDSRICLKYNGESACSRWCNAVTGVGCPGDIDVNGDGEPDGGFDCKLISGDGRCWPRAGPIEPPDGWPEDSSGGCCNASRAKPGDLVLSALFWLPFCWWSRRRRRMGRHRP